MTIHQQGKQLPIDHQFIALHYIVTPECLKKLKLAHLDLIVYAIQLD